MSYYTVSQSQFTKGGITTEVVRTMVDSSSYEYGVRAWFKEDYLGIDWYKTEKEARAEARRIINLPLQG